MYRKILLTLVFMLGLTNIAFADTWTGCVNPGGQIHHLNQGDVPLRPCNEKSVIIHLSDLASKTSGTQFIPDTGGNGNTGTTTPGATYDHDLVCKALDEAGATSDTLAALGCPSGNEPVPDNTAEVTRYYGSATGLTFESCSSGNGYCFKVSGAFVGNQFQVPNAGLAQNWEDDGFCPTACNSDDRCFMAWLENADLPIQGNGVSGGDHPSLVCHLFYRSEGVDFEHYCGFRPEICSLNVTQSQPFWKRTELQ